ncbi:protein CPR-5 [Rutidosis leptorrhynchoides]|uniref:protein CPR-5 n=1 Tax=Rutidosis leptorrhynchoides TaxID=125765 RepID=UPI003A9A54D6
MESPLPPSPQPPITAAGVSTADSNLSDDQLNQPLPTTNTTIIKKNMKNKRKRKDVTKSQTDVVSDPLQESIDSALSSSSSCSTSKLSHLKSKGIRISTNRTKSRNLKGSISKRSNEADALALPLGMSIAAFIAQVLDKKDASGEKMSVDHLSEICTLAVKESLSNVFGNKFDCFVSNFERSFQSTLMTLRVINDSSRTRKKTYSRTEGSSTNFHFDMKDNTSTSQEQKSILDLDEVNVPRDPIYNELAVIHDPINGQQLTCIPPNRVYSGDYYNRSMISTFEKSVAEQARSNNIKELKFSLSLEKMRQKEAEIAVNRDSNFLERVKLSMGFSKANFKAEKFKTELEESRHAQLLRNCADCLVAGLLIMVFCLIYGTYVYSYERLVEATESCMPIQESSSWWTPKPIASFSSGFQTLRCLVQVTSRMLFGILMILAITFLLIQRSGTANQTMPITYILLLLGIGCGFAGKFCIDTLGGSGTHWFVYWEVLCLVHLFANSYISMLFVILHGPVKVTNQLTSRKFIGYRFRRFVFYFAVLLGLPLLCGLMPFAGPREWLEHFGSLVMNSVSED